MKKLLFILCILLFSSFVVSARTLQQIYEIEFLKSEPIKAKVKAVIELVNDTLYVGEFGSWHEKEGWATYIKDLEVTSAKGVQIKLEKIDRLKWRLVGNYPKTIHLNYSVIFPYSIPDYHQWPAGPRSTAAYYDGKGLFLNAQSLFIFNSHQSSTSVRIILPEDWKISTPWPQTKKKSVYGGIPLESFYKTAIVVGKHNEFVINDADFGSKLIFLGYKNADLSIVSPVFKKVIKHHIQVFNHSERGNYLMVWFPDGQWETGEGYQDSYVVVAPTSPSIERYPIWANTIAHETFHYWMGQRIDASDWASSQWFSEGITEYYANLSLIANNIISEQQFFNILQKHLVLYQNFRYKWGTPYEKISLVEAGSNKSTYNAAVYDAGTITAMCMDIKIRQETNNKRSLKDVLRILYAESLDNNGSKYTMSHVFAIFNKVTDSDWTEFFDKYVNGTQMLPVEDYLSRAGITAIVSQAGVHIEKKANASELEVLIRKAILDGEE